MGVGRPIDMNAQSYSNFRALSMAASENFIDWKSRLGPICQRTKVMSGSTHQNFEEAGVSKDMPGPELLALS
ncbi:hypothetical protein Tco_1068788 [Tanacetum coccineum]|uniref:Uncharacterized protein n=1 Tax=Tanacetum coccineum TaxID=301880 RepID=A0ABQ5HI64_9ASTR